MADVTVRFWAGARAAAGADEMRRSAPSVHALVDALSAQVPTLAPVLALSSLLVDGHVVRHDAGHDLPLVSGQVVEVLPPFAGG